MNRDKLIKLTKANVTMSAAMWRAYSGLLMIVESTKCPSALLHANNAMDAIETLAKEVMDITGEDPLEFVNENPFAPKPEVDEIEAWKRSTLYMQKMEGDEPA